MSLGMNDKPSANVESSALLTTFSPVPKANHAHYRTRAILNEGRESGRWGEGRAGGM